jgi:hypothetical protein
MTLFTFDNFINTTLAANVTSGATTITLASSTGLPSSITSGQALAIILSDQATRSIFEVLYATAISGTTLTVQRGREGTTALAWSTGDYAYSDVTAGQMAGVAQLAQFTSGSGAHGYWRQSPDGFLEQWGTVTNTGSGARSQVIVMSKSFSNTNYDVSATDVGAECYAYGAVANSVLNFLWYIPAGSIGPSTTVSTSINATCNWRARGF